MAGKKYLLARFEVVSSDFSESKDAVLAAVPFSGDLARLSVDIGLFFEGFCEGKVFLRVCQKSKPSLERFSDDDCDVGSS